MRFLPPIASLTAVATAVAAAAVTSPRGGGSGGGGSGLDCRSVQLNIPAAGDNVHFTNLPDQNNATAIKEWLLAALTDPTGSYKDGFDHISGTYSVGATYCKPSRSVRDRRALQVMVHGISYNKEMWAGLGFSDVYNWHAYATRAGYHTLAVNRMGHGQTTNLPSPFAEVQGPLQAVFTRNLVRRLRNGLASGVLPAFRKIVYVGHSYGSWLGNHLAADDPSAVDAYVLTGYSGTVALPINLTLDFFSAAVVDPARFAGVPLGYLAGQTESVRTNTFYAGSFSPAIAHRDFQTHDTFAVGEGLSPAFTPLQTAYTGPVLLVTGNLDILFCQKKATSCPAILNQTRDYFHQAQFSILSPANTGHTLSLHSSAPQMIRDVHHWLNGHFA